MMKKFILIIIVLGLGLNTNAQNSVQQTATDIVSNNLIIKALGIENQIKMLEDRKALIPDDPELIGAYLWGSPSFIGKRKNLNAHQRIKFPTYYSQLKKVNDLSTDLYGINLDSEINRVLFESLDLMIDMVHLSGNKEVIRERLVLLRQIHSLAAKMFDAGETNRIELEKASLLVDIYQQDLLMLISEEKIIGRQLVVLNAGQGLDLHALKYSDFEEMYSNRKANSAMVDNPVLELAKINKQLAGANVDFAKTAYLPDLQFGFVRETIRDEKLAGVEFGISIPIWGKSNQVKKARLGRDLSEYNETLTKLLISNDWDNLNEMARQSIEIKGNLESSLNSLKSKELLEESWKQGEISLLDYLKELPFYYGVEDRVIEAERQYYKALLNRNSNHLSQMIGL